MALPSNNQNNKDAIKGFILIASIVIGIIAVVLYLIPNEQEPITEPISTTKPTAVLDPNSKDETIRLILSYYKSIDKPLRDLHLYCEDVSNYDEYYEFTLILGEITPILKEIQVYDTQITESITRFGLEDNTDIRNSIFSLDVLLGVTNQCIQEKADIYG